MSVFLGSTNGSQGFLEKAKYIRQTNVYLSNYYIAPDVQIQLSAFLSMQLLITRMSNMYKYS